MVQNCVPLPGCVHGGCVDAYECRCFPGWTGIFCSRGELQTGMTGSCICWTTRLSGPKVIYVLCSDFSSNLPARVQRDDRILRQTRKVQVRCVHPDAVKLSYVLLPPLKKTY